MLASLRRRGHAGGAGGGVDPARAGAGPEAALRQRRRPVQAAAGHRPPARLDRSASSTACSPPTSRSSSTSTATRGSFTSSPTASRATSNLHVHGYREKGNINTPFELAMLNETSRFHLVIDVIDRVPKLREKAGHLKEEMQQRDHRQPGATRTSTARTAPRSPTGPGRTSGTRRAEGLSPQGRPNADRSPNMSDALLVLNAGSSSLKFSRLHRRAVRRGSLAARARSRRSTTRPRFVTRAWRGRIPCSSVAWPAGTPLGHDGRHRPPLLDWGREALLGARRVVAVGHRVVHGGARYLRAGRWSTPPLSRSCEALVPLAPLHQPHNLAAIRAVAQKRRRACRRSPASIPPFTAPNPSVAQMFALPRRYAEEGVRRYGFHGLSYEYIASVLPSMAPEAAARPHGRRPPRQRREHVRHAGGPQRRHDHELHRAGRSRDGDPLRLDRSRASCST